MSSPIFPEVDPTTGALPAFTEARYLSATAGAQKAPLVGAALVTPTATTPSAGDNDTSVATTAFVQTELAAQPVSTLEKLDDRVAALLVAGSGVTLTYNDGAGSLTIAAVAADAELIRDTIGTALVEAGLIDITVDDAGDTITIGSTHTSAQLLDRANHTGVQTMSTVTDLETSLDALQAQIDALKTEKVDTVKWSTGGAGWGTYTTSTSRVRHFSSTNDVAATPPTFYSVHDKWFAHKDAV